MKNNLLLLNLKRNKKGASITQMVVASTFLFICAVSLLFFAIDYPALNGQTTILSTNPTFNNTANNISALLGNYQTTTNSQIQATTNDTPTTSGLTVQLISTVSVARTEMSQLQQTFNLLVDLVSNILGLSSTSFLFILGALIAMFAFVLLYVVLKFIRWGTDP